MNNILKTVLPVIAIFPTFSMNNTYSMEENYQKPEQIIIAKKMKDIFDKVNKKIDDMQEMFQNITDLFHVFHDEFFIKDCYQFNKHGKLMYLPKIIIGVWNLKNHVSNLHEYYNKDLNDNTQRLLDEYIGKYFDIMDLLKEGSAMNYTYNMNKIYPECPKTYSICSNSNEETKDIFNKIEKKTDEMKEISKKLIKFRFNDTTQYLNMDLKSIEDELKDLSQYISIVWNLPFIASYVHETYSRSSRSNDDKELLYQYIVKYFDIVNLLKEAL